jgi:hypothetical protein
MQAHRKKTSLSSAGFGDLGVLGALGFLGVVGSPLALDEDVFGVMLTVK